MSLIEEGIRSGILSLDIENHTVTYKGCGTSRSILNPEEKVQVDAYVKLVQHWHYPVENIRVCHSVKMGSSRKEADLVVFSDTSFKKPEIVVECKKRKISQEVFAEATEQGFSYAHALSANYVWVTSGNQNAFFERWEGLPGERESNRLPQLPSFQKANTACFNTRKKLWRFRQKFSKYTRFIPQSWRVGLVFQLLSFLFLTILFFDQYESRKEHWLFPEIFKKGFLIPYLIVGVSSLITAWSGKALAEWPGSSNSSKKQHRISIWGVLASVFPFALSAYGFSRAWWNFVHYEKLALKSWLFLQPYLWVFASYFATVVLLAFLKKKGLKK